MFGAAPTDAAPAVSSFGDGFGTGGFDAAAPAAGEALAAGAHPEGRGALVDMLSSAATPAEETQNL
jgi:hypothetical protein